MGYPKYEEDNRESLQERRASSYSQWYDPRPAKEEYVPYAIRYQLPEVKTAPRRKIRYAYCR